MVFFICILMWLIFLFDVEITYSKKQTTHKFEYNGLLWVGLDYYTIIKYHSNDKPMKWFNYTKAYEN